MTIVTINNDYVTNLLITPEETYIISLDNHLDTFEKNKDKFELVNGIYIKNSYTPLIEFNSIYYIRTENDYQVITSNDDIKINKGNVYKLNRSGYELYITYKQLKKIENQLTIEPNSNYVYLLFIKELIDQIINSYMYYRTYVSQTKLKSYIKEKYIYYIKTDIYVDDFSNLFDEIYNIIKDHRWSIFFTKTFNNSIIVERTCDYRVYEWCNIQLKDDNE